MDYKLMLEKTVDLLINLAVVSVGVSAFEEKYSGIFVAIVSYAVAMWLCRKIGVRSWISGLQSFCSCVA